MNNYNNSFKKLEIKIKQKKINLKFKNKSFSLNIRILYKEVEYREIIGQM